MTIDRLSSDYQELMTRRFRNRVRKLEAHANTHQTKGHVRDNEDVQHAFNPRGVGPQVKLKSMLMSRNPQAYLIRLRGPASTVDGACSSSRTTVYADL